VQLHDLLLRIARGEVHRRREQLPLSGPELDDVAHQAAADTLVAITAKIGQFCGDGRFITWAYKFVISRCRQRSAGTSGATQAWY
jgi:RNA polymerase sigma-70 factor, ECF subfamily